MKLLYFALFLLAAGLVFFLLNRLILKLAYPLEKRYLHCRIVPALLLTLLAVANVYTVSYPLQALDAIINAPGLAYFFSLVLPNRAYELVYMLLVHLGLNLMAMLLVILVIGIIRLIFLRSTGFIDIDDYFGFSRLLHLPWLVTGKFYKEQDGAIRLTGKGFTLGLWVKGLKWTFAILWILELLCVAVSILWGSDDWNGFLLTVTKNWYLLPMASFQLLQQLQLCLEGVTEDEAGTFGSAVIQETQSGSISALQDACRQIFSRSDALLFSDISGNKAAPRDGLGSNDLGNQQIEDCSQPDVLNVIVNQLQQCGANQNEQYQNALVELLNGRSINICDQCEGDFLVFLCAYLNFHMSQGRTALMLCRDRKRADQLCRAVNREMQRLNSLYSIWNIRTLEGAEINSRMSMLICSVDDFLSHHISEKRQDFVSDLFCTVFTDGIHLFSGDRLCIERLFGILRGINGSMQYIAFSDINNDALRTAMEQVTKQEILPFTSNIAQNPNAGIMIWRGESSCRLQQQIGLGNTLSPYMGAALPLALVAIKFDFPRVYLISNNAPGIFSFNDVLHMSVKEVSAYIAKNVNLKSLIRYHLDEALQRQELSVTIVHDTEFNFLNTLTLWQKYCGTKGSLLHIISPPYALREYFVANFHSKKLGLKSGIFDALISSHLGTKISHMVVLLVSLCDKGMTEKELMDKVKEYHWEYENVDQLLRDCLSVVLTREEIHGIYECFHFEEEKFFREDRGTFETQTRITLIDATIRRRLHDLSGYASLISKDDQRQTLPILCGNIYNYCLRNQIISVGGYLHQIRSISEDRIHAEQVLPQDLPEYFQLCEFVFENYRQTDSSIDTGILDLNLCTADVSRNIYGYLACNRGNSFAANSSLLVNNLGQCIHTHQDCVNILEVNVRRAELGDQAVEVMRLFAYLIKDFSRTLFPVTHQNLYTVLAEGVDDSLLPRVLTSGNQAALEDLVCCLVPRLKNPNEQNADYITLYVVEYSCVEFGMVQMLHSRYQNLLMMIREYLSWYLSSNGGSGDGSPGRYLHFGGEEVPGVLASEALLALCRKMAPQVEDVVEPVQVPVDVNVPLCTFCERPSMFPVELSDGRRMCGHCKDHQLTQKDEIKSMFTQTQRYLTEGYSITLPQNLHVRFQSASAIARATGGVSGGRILGFYNFRSHQLWLEARGPRIAMQSTLIHELTHAWQDHDPDFRQKLQEVLKTFPKTERDRIRLVLLEGHAVFMEVETMRKMHEEAFAGRLHESSMRREDVYGVGYRMVRDYIISQGDLGSHMTPFKAMTQLLQDILDGKVSVS